MANATSEVKGGVVTWNDEYVEHSFKTLAAETRLYVNAMLGFTVDGRLAKYDDTASMLLAGVVRQREGNPLLPIGTAGDEALNLQIHQPRRLELTVASIAVTDIGKTVYASDDQTGTLASTTTFGNPVGIVVRVAGTNLALVELFYGFRGDNQRYNVARVMAATGAQSLTKWDLNKTILLPNTAAYTLTLPAVADTQAGDRLTFLKSTTDAAAVTLDGNASETIDGATTLATIDAFYDTAILVSTGAAWIVLARDIA